MTRRILIVADRPGWVFDSLATAIKVNCPSWEVSVRYLFQSVDPCTPPNIKDFDILFYLCDFAPQYLPTWKIPKEKVILAIRSEVTHSLYRLPDFLMKTVAALAVANLGLKERFISNHPEVCLLPGGVDTEMFIPKEKEASSPLTVGWAGSRSNFGPQVRGLDFIQKACHVAGLRFNPAIREDRWRTKDEMVRYYQDEIDIYVDMSTKAGRQNGLLEAGACGRPLIATRAGVSNQLIQHGVNGFLINGNLDDLVHALKEMPKCIKEFGSQIREEIELNWSWVIHAKQFEALFNSVYEKSVPHV